MRRVLYVSSLLLNILVCISLPAIHEIGEEIEDEASTPRLGYIESPPVSPRLRLIHAAYAGSLYKVHLYLEHGDDVNAQDETGHTALMYAASEGHYEIVQKLLAHGASVNFKNSSTFSTAFTCALINCKNVHTAIAHLLISHGADINVVNKDGNSILMLGITAYPERTERILAYLFAHASINPFIKNNSGKSALELVYERRNFFNQEFYNNEKIADTLKRYMNTFQMTHIAWLVRYRTPLYKKTRRRLTVDENVTRQQQLLKEIYTLEHAHYHKKKVSHCCMIQ